MVQTSSTFTELQVSVPLHCTALHFTALHCTVWQCTALHCAVLNCTALHCTALNFLNNRKIYPKRKKIQNF